MVKFDTWGAVRLAWACLLALVLVGCDGISGGGFSTPTKNKQTDEVPPSEPVGENLGENVGDEGSGDPPAGDPPDGDPPTGNPPPGILPPPIIVPEPQAATATGKKNLAIDVSLADQLAGHEGAAIVIETPLMEGSAEVQADGSTIRYTPELGFVGDVAISFSIVVKGEESETSATLTITVPNIPPEASAATLTVSRGGSAVLQLAATDADPEENLVYSLAADPPGVTLPYSLTPEGSLTYDAPPGGLVPTDTVTVFVTDGTDTTSFDVTVSITNDAPTLLLPTTLRTFKNTEISGTYTASDINLDPLAVELVTGPAHGTLTVTPVPGTGGYAGTVAYMPDTGYVGTDSISFKIVDGLDESPVQTISVAVDNRDPQIVSTPVLAHSVPAAPGDILDIPMVVRDFRDDHPDMQRGVFGLQQGLVEDHLVDGLPVFADPSYGFDRSVESAESFDQWYRDVPGTNARVDQTLRLTRNDAGIYSFEDNNFFLLDGVPLGPGFDHQGRDHNYHFTMALQSAFTYQGTEEFTFFGDDDLWVFINGHLAIDIGGVHDSITDTVRLPDVATEFGLEVGETYSFHLFFAERHTTMSVFRIDTGIALSPSPPYSYQVVGSDPDPGEVLTYTLSTGPAGMTIDADTGAILWAPDPAEAGTHPVTVTVTDGSGVAVMQSFSVVLTVE